MAVVGRVVFTRLLEIHEELASGASDKSGFSHPLPKVEQRASYLQHQKLRWRKKSS